MRSLFFSMVLAVLIGWAQISGASTTAIIGFSPSGTLNITNPLTTGVTSGSSYSFDVYVTLLTPGDIVSAYNLDVLYPYSILRPSSSGAVTFDRWLGDPLATPDPEAYQTFKTGTDGVLNFLALSLLPDADLLALQATNPNQNKIRLATLKFDAVDTASATLSFDWSNARGIRDIKGLNNQMTTIIPEPSTYLLAVIAAAAVAAAARLRRRTVESV